MPRLAFVTSHPIQYQIPVFRHLAACDELQFEAWFAMLPDAAAQGAGFGVEFEWDIPLLEGYDYRVLKNVSSRPGVTHFSGCDTPDIAEQLRQHQIDAVVVNGWVVKTCVQTLRACRNLKIPCIVRGEANHLRPRPWWKRFLQKRLVRQFDAYLPIGTANRHFYKSYGISSDRMFDARYCIENDRFARAADSFSDQRTELRKQWNMSGDEICFLFCGKMESKKHPVELIQAVQRAVSGGAKLHLLMVGDGQLKKECEKLAQQHQLSVTFTGFLNQSQIVQAYVAADALLLPSDHGETWGLVVNEGMACGLPAIVSDQVGCASDLIDEGRTGWSFPFGEWDKLTDLLVTLSASPQEVRSLTQNCRQKISNYTPKAAANGIVDAVLNVLRKPVKLSA